MGQSFAMMINDMMATARIATKYRSDRVKGALI